VKDPFVGGVEPSASADGKPQSTAMSKYQLTADALALVSDLKAPVSRDAFLRKHGGTNPVSVAQAAEVWDSLMKAGLLRGVQTTEQPGDLATSFGAWRSHRGMLADSSRVMAFRKAIEARVRPGDHVIDVGAGSGILSLLAARAGARVVHALEATSIIEDARAIAEINGLADRIRFVRGDAAGFINTEPADLVIGEWAGMYLFEEWRHFDAFAQVRDKHLTLGGVVIPAKARVFLSPIEDSRLYVERGPGFWERPVWGFDFGLVHAKQLDRTRRIIVQAAKQGLLFPEEILTVDCASADSRAYFFEHEFAYAVSHDATCHGFLGYFTLELAPDIVLDTSPFSAETSWRQSYFPIEQIPVSRGDTLVISIKAAPDAFTASPVLAIRAELKRAGRTAALRERVYTLDDTQG
jgi:predicted nicotinamide N-methyase